MRRTRSLMIKYAGQDMMSRWWQYIFAGSKTMRLSFWGRRERGLRAARHVTCSWPTDDPSLQPVFHPEKVLLGNVVYGVQPSAVDKVVAGGSLAVSSGCLERVSEQRIAEQVEHVVARWPAPWA